MVKTIYQEVPSEYESDYKKTCLHAYKPGFNFYIDEYNYIYAFVSRLHQRHEQPPNKRGLPPDYMMNARLRRWTFRESARLWWQEPRKTDYSPPIIKKYGREYWRSITPPPNWRMYAWYRYITAMYLQALRRPPWGTTPDLYVTNPTTAEIIRIDLNVPQQIAIYGGSGSEPGEFNTPNGIAEDNGSLYICDTGNQRIQILSSETGTYLKMIVEYGNPPTTFVTPLDIAVDTLYIYVLDSGKNTLIKILKTDYTNATEISLYSNIYHNISSPSNILLTYSDIYISSVADHRIIRLKKDTLKRQPMNTINESTPQDLLQPRGMDTNGVFLLIADKEKKQIIMSTLTYFSVFATTDVDGDITDIATIGELSVILEGAQGRIIIYNLPTFGEKTTLSLATLQDAEYFTTRQQQYFLEDIK